MRALSALVAALVLLALASPAFARFAALIMDADTGEVLYEANGDLPRFPASLTKMMTLYLLFDAMRDGRVRPNDAIVLSERAASQPPTKLGLVAGSQLTVENAILALVTRSANDVATAIAEYLGGSEWRFSSAMTAQAHALGMTNTRFFNASGLPDDDQVTTARDMAILARALLRDFPEYYHYFSTRTFYYDGVAYRNHNRMLFNHDGVDGIKTGYIRASGFNLVVSAVRDGRRLIGVVFGARSPSERGQVMASLLDNGFRGAQNDAFVTAAVAYRPPPAIVEAKRRAPAQAGADRASIHIGAYRDRSSALMAAKAAKQRLPAVLGSGRAEVISIRGKGRKAKTTHMASIAGISSPAALQACQVLKRKQAPCTVVRTAPRRAVFAQPEAPAADSIRLTSRKKTPVGAKASQTPKTKIARTERRPKLTGVQTTPAKNQVKRPSGSAPVPNVRTVARAG